MSDLVDRKPGGGMPLDRPTTLNGVPLRRSPPDASRPRATSWTLIQNAAGRPTAEARRALVGLCAAYWPPVYALLRRRGCDPRLAHDLMRAFFTLLVEKQYLLDAEHRVGRFRSFLLATIKRFMVEEAWRTAAIAGTGSFSAVEVDGLEAERSFAQVANRQATPEALFERRWVLSVLERVMTELRNVHAETQDAIPFERLLPFLSVPRDPVLYDAAASELGISSGALQVAARRLRRAYRLLLRAEISETLSSLEETDEEIRFLLSTSSETDPRLFKPEL